MANAVTTNYPLFSSNDMFSAIWKLTRTMLSAGWRYKGSGNGQNLYGTGTSGTGGAYIASSFNCARSGGGASVVAFSSNIMTITVPNNYTGTGNIQGTISVTNGSTTISFSANQTLPVGGAFVFNTSSQPSTLYFNSAAISNTNTLTLATNFTGTTQSSVAASYLFALPGTVTLSGSTSVTTSSSWVGIVTPGEQIVFSPQPGTTYTVTAVTSSTVTLSSSYTGSTGSGKYAVVTSTLNAGMIGQYVTLSGAANSSGTINGTWRITGISTTANSFTVYNAAGASTDSNNGSINWACILDAAGDQWGAGGAVNLSNAGRISNSGAGVGLAAAGTGTSGLSVVTGITGATQASVGDYLTITGSSATGGPNNSTGTNNGSWRIVAVSTAGTSCTVYAPGMVAETGNASLNVVEQYGGAGASITSFSSTTSGQSTLMTLTGLSGLSSSDVGRFITLINPTSVSNIGSFLIVSVLSSSSCLIYNPNATASDAHNGSIQWVEYSTLSQTYPLYIQSTTGGSAWIDLQGPTIMKIPIGTNVPSGTFIRGENVTQTSSGAQGELLGIVQDATGGAGFLVIAPRVVGTGSYASPVATYGWNNTANVDTVTGSWSGATVNTPASSVPIAYVRETVIWKNYNNSGIIWHQCIDQNSSTESAITPNTGRLSTMANTLPQMTGNMAPGGSGGSNNPTLNGFSNNWVGTYCVMGYCGQGTPFGSAPVNNAWAYWPGCINISPGTGKAQLLVANCVEQQGISADGTWLYLQGVPSTGYQCLSYLRLDNQEDGDLDPYVHQAHYNGSLNGAATRIISTNATSGSGSTTDNMNTAAAWNNSTASHGFTGFRRRGLLGETFNNFSVAILRDYASSNYPITTNTSNPDTVSHAVTSTWVREPFWLYLTPFPNNLASGRMRKGTPRWLQLVESYQTNGTAMAVNSTFDSAEWVVLSPTSNASFTVGLFDGGTSNGAPIF